MCWSGEASAVLASIGLGTTIYSAIKRTPAALWITLGYFSLMELLQAFTYQVINQCGSETNQVLTLLGYLHICFQPFFVNALSMYFLPEKKKANIAIPAYGVCFVASIIMIIQLQHFSWAGPCVQGEPLCAKMLCSVSGNWHIAWDLPLNGLALTFKTAFFTFRVPAFIAAYFVASFLMPFIYGAWRGTVFHLVMGPFLAWLTTDNMNEWPAVWCLLSIGIIMLVIKVRFSPLLRKVGFPMVRQE